jgi:hypothetical protein
MALTNCRLWMGGYELSGHLNSIGVEYGAEMLDDTVFGTGGTRSNKPGLKTLTITGGGFWDDTIDEPIYDRIGATREVVAVSPTGQTDGDRVFFTRAVNGSYNPLTGEIGQLLGFELDFHAANCLLVRGAVGGTGSKTATGTGTPIQLGTVPLGSKVYAALFVKDTILGTLPTLDVTVESDNLVGFASPTTRLTFTQVTTVIGGQWQELAGPITDDWWRVKWTIAGTTPTYPLFVVIGII